MEDKYQRLSTILRIIQENQVTSQEQLLGKLRSEGFDITQATLSRDLKHLKVAKLPGSKGAYHYVLPASRSYAASEDDPSTASSLEGFLSLEFSGNVGVIRTVPAYSHTIASALDSANFKSIAGTVAGNDTIILVIREGYTREDIRANLVSAFPGLIDKMK